MAFSQVLKDTANAFEQADANSAKTHRKHCESHWTGTHSISTLSKPSRSSSNRICNVTQNSCNSHVIPPLENPYNSAEEADADPAKTDSKHRERHWTGSDGVRTGREPRCSRSNRRSNVSKKRSNSYSFHLISSFSKNIEKYLKNIC